MVCYPWWHDTFKRYRGLTYPGGYTVPSPESAPSGLIALGLEDFVPFEPEELRQHAEAQLRAMGLLSGELSQNAYSLGRNIATEAGSKASAEQKVAMGLSTVNHARLVGKTVHAVIVGNNKVPNRYGRIHFHGDSSVPAPYGRFTASTKEPTVEDLLIAKFILEGGAGMFPNDFAGGADDQAQVRTPGWVQTLALKRKYWVGHIPGVNPAQVTLFKTMPDIAPASPMGQALTARALTMIALTPGEFPADCVEAPPGGSTASKIFFIGTAALAVSAGVVWWHGRRKRTARPRAVFTRRRAA